MYLRRGFHSREDRALPKAKRAKDRAIVIGASVAGLAAARVLSDHFSEVVVVERALRGSGTAVPQARHAHVLLAAGGRVLDRLFPGFTRSLERAGGRVGRMGIDCFASLPSGRSYGLGWRQPDPIDLQVPLYSQSRALFDEVLLDRCRSLAGVRFLLGTRVLGLSLAFGRVDGVVIESRGGARTLAAGLVVDASGSGSRLPVWLAAQGIRRPPEDGFEIDLAYASGVFTAADGFDAISFTVPAAIPMGTRSGLLCRIEDGQWIVSLGGSHGDHPSSTLRGFRDFARSLPSDALYRLIAGRKPAQDLARFRFRANRYRRYDRVSGLPAGVVAIGDALCCLNPIHGQGMALALLEAELLGEILASTGIDESFGTRYFVAVDRVVRDALRWSRAMHHRQLGRAGEEPPGVAELARHLGALAVLAADDERLAVLLTRVNHLLAPLSDLETEDLVARAAELERPPVAAKTSRRRSSPPWRSLFS